MPIVSIPFYLIFGKMGFLIFNLAQIFALIYGLMVLAGGGPGGRLLALAGFVSTPFLPYTFNYSPDVFGTALLVWSYIFGLRNRPLVCGLLAGLAVWAKVYLALLLLPLALIVLPQGWKATLACGLSAFVALMPMLAINTHLFGAPWITGYDREAHFIPAGIVVTDHYSRFNQPILPGLFNLLFDYKVGLLRTAPLWFLWPAGLIAAWRFAPRSARLGLTALTLALLVNLLFFARYDEWDKSAFGNRFLFPALALGLAVQGPLWEKCVSSCRRVR
jgi:hypothetical protein